MFHPTARPQPENPAANARAPAPGVSLFTKPDPAWERLLARRRKELIMSHLPYAAALAAFITATAIWLMPGVGS